MIRGSATTADLHIRDYIWSSRPRLSKDAIIAMQYVFNYCIENDLSLKIAGDAFHTLAVLPEHVGALFTEIDKMREAGLPVYYIQGNHDLNAQPWMSLHPWPTDLDLQLREVDEANEVVYGLQSRGEDELKQALQNVPERANTLLMHQAEVRAMPFNPNFDLNDVPPHIRLVLIGDIHAAQMYRNENTMLCYPGSPSVTDIGQTAQRSFVREDPSSDGSTSVSQIFIPGRSVSRFDIHSEADVERVEAAVRQLAQEDPRHAGLEPLVRIVFKPDLSERVQQLFLPMRDTLEVYTWLDVMTAETQIQEAIMADMPGIQINGIMEKVITDNVSDPSLRDVVLKIYKDGDVGAVLTPELEALL